MNTFIKKHEFNYIKKSLGDLNNAFRNCTDPKIIETTKLYIQEKIFQLFPNLSEEEKSFLEISRITTPLHIESYLTELNEYTYRMPSITKSQLIKLFRKEKKLKLPELKEDSKNVYLGWINEGNNKLFIAYNMNGKLLGMTCTITPSNPNVTNVCALCNNIGDENEIAFVSAICKAPNGKKDAYRSIGFHICLDSSKCNEKIVNINNLENLLKNVNNIK